MNRGGSAYRNPLQEEERERVRKMGEGREGKRKGGCGRVTWLSFLGMSTLNSDSNPPEEWACLWLTHDEAGVQSD